MIIMIIVIISVCVCVYTNTPYCPANIVIYLTLPLNRFAPDRRGLVNIPWMEQVVTKTLLVNINWVKKPSEWWWMYVDVFFGVRGLYYDCSVYCWFLYIAIAGTVIIITTFYFIYIYILYILYILYVYIYIIYV